MPHLMKEYHLEEICANCKKPHGNNIEIFHEHHKIYETIHCVNCGYEIIRKKDELRFNNHLEFI